ncbi:MAG: class I SAM-dependent methyltransferase [Candidatus Krumholzibacteriia bacterium]
MSVKSEVSRGNWSERYRDYQSKLAERYLIPTLEAWGVHLDGIHLLEVGCGDGGCGAAFFHAGARVVMMDIEERLVATAERFNRRDGVTAKTFVGDILDDTGKVYREGAFDLVMFRDVMEHLAEPVRVLDIVREHLTPSGRVFVVFPPYYSPYGAHQQLLPRTTLVRIPYNKLPYLQLLPDPWFLPVTKGDSGAHREVKRLRSIRLTIRGFEKHVREAGFRVTRKRFYLSRPSFALRYGAPVIGAGPLGRVPFLNEVLVTAAYYLLEADESSGHRARSLT